MVIPSLLSIPRRLCRSRAQGIRWWVASAASPHSRLQKTTLGHPEQGYATETLPRHSRQYCSDLWGFSGLRWVPSPSSIATMLPIGIEVRARAVRPFPTSSKISKFPLILGSVEFGFNGPGMILYILNCYSFRTWERRCFCLRLICLPSKLFNTLLKYQQLFFLLLLKGFTHMQNCCEIFLDFLGLV